MSDLHTIIEKLEAYCASTGLSPATVCNRATNNARLFDRLKNRAQQTDKDVLALEKYMASNPPQRGRNSLPAHQPGALFGGCE